MSGICFFATEMNNPFDYSPDYVCNAEFQKLCRLVDSLKRSSRPEDVNFCRELASGKMIGILIARDSAGNRHSLYAFSGQLGKNGFLFPGFVGPVFDYLLPDGFFKINEEAISRQNVTILKYEKEVIAVLQAERDRLKAEADARLASFREECRLNKLARKLRRESGLADETELTALLRRSQFEKAELHRLKKKLAEEIKPAEEKLNDALTLLRMLKEKRRHDSEKLQDWLFSNSQLLNARGESKNLREIFADTSLKIPPSGAGECCGPKLLQEAYRHHWQPLQIAEYWYGTPKDGEIRVHGQHYPACRTKCGPVMSWMLQGLNVEPPLCDLPQSLTDKKPEILFANDYFCVVKKPAGLLSVPGKGDALSVERWLQSEHKEMGFVKMVHRLDQDTSGLLIAAFSAESLKALQSLFARREVNKTYVAILEGDFLTKGLPKSGRIELPLLADWLDRPRQKVNFEEGKPAITDFEFIETSQGRSRVLFHPLTGRTHQLRLHAASPLGLGMSIVGDRLYGLNIMNRSVRLMLHAQKIEFNFPLDGTHYCFEDPAPF